MTDAAADLDRALRRVHRGVLATLGVCAVVVAAGAAGETAEVAPVPPAPYLGAALALALISILARAPARRGPPLTRSGVYALLASLLCAGAIGVVGVMLALFEAMWRAALLYTVAGLLLALRPPPPSA